MYNNNATSTITDKQGLLRLSTILFSALVLGQIMFGAIVLFALNNGKMQFNIPKSDDPFVFVVPVMAIASIAAGIFLFNTLRQKAKEKEDLPAKLQAYLTAMIVRFALIEGVSLLGIVVGMINNNLFYLGISGLLIVYMISLRPTSYRIDNDLDL